MSKVFDIYERISSKFFLLLSLMGLLVLSNLYVPQPSYATSLEELPTDEVVQPFELTRPAEGREGAYEEAAKLVENPKELVKAQNQEEKAQEKVVEKEMKK
jgi:hypothetical protein